MMLGQGFLWTDLVAYVIGITIIYLVFNEIARTEKTGKKENYLEKI